MHAARGAAIRAVMERRLLASYRTEPAVLQAVLPAPFRQALVDGYEAGSTCLIRPGTATADSAFAVTGSATWRPSAPLLTSPGKAVPAGRP